MLLGGDLRNRGDRALEHQTRAGADDDVTSQEDAKARGRQPNRDGQQAKPHQQRRDRRSQQLLRRARSRQRLRERRRGKRGKGDGARQQMRGLMQRLGKETRRERGQEPEDRIGDRRAKRGGDETTAGARRHRQALRPVARSRRPPSTRLGRGKKHQPREYQCRGEHHERHEQRASGPLRKRTGDQPAEAQAAQVGGSRNDLRTPAASASQLCEPRHGRRGHRAHAKPAEHPSQKQPGQRGPDHEHHAGEDLHRERRHQHAATAMPVGEMAHEEQAERNRQRIDGEHDRDRERREPVALRVQPPQRGRHGRERHDRRERERDHPEPDSGVLRS